MNSKQLNLLQMQLVSSSNNGIFFNFGELNIFSEMFFKIPTLCRLLRAKTDLRQQDATRTKTVSENRNFHHRTHCTENFACILIRFSKPSEHTGGFFRRTEYICFNFRFSRKTVKTHWWKSYGFQKRFWLRTIGMLWPMTGISILRKLHPNYPSIYPDHFLQFELPK